MINPKTFEFLTKLKKNNNKVWFDKNRETYEMLREDFKKFVDELIAEISKFDKSVIGLTSKNCLFRINRDIRFSKDKSPYKTNFGAYIAAGGKKSSGPGYYIHVQPGECFMGGGVYSPEPAQLNAIRQEIDYNSEEFEKILKNKDFKKHFGKLWDEDKLVNPPKGYDKNLPYIDHLKHKHYVATGSFTEKQAASKAFITQCAQTYKALYPLHQFLGRALD